MYMYVYVYIYMYIYIYIFTYLHIYICIYTWGNMNLTQIWGFARKYSHTSKYANIRERKVCIYIYIYIYRKHEYDTNMSICEKVLTCIKINGRKHKRTIYIYIYIYIYTYIHIYIYTYIYFKIVTQVSLILANRNAGSLVWWITFSAIYEDQSTYTLRIWYKHEHVYTDMFTIPCTSQRSS